MPRFEICVIETREHFFEIEAANSEEAEMLAYDLDTGESLREAYREHQVDWVRKIEEDTDA